MLKKIALGCFTILLSSNLAFALNEPHKVKILDLKNGGGYTYLKVSENNQEYWTAINQTQLKIGDTITINEQVWMKNFKSKALNQTFEKILFAEIEINKENMLQNIHNIHGDMIKKKQQEELRPNPKFNENITLADNKPINTTINELYTNSEKYKNKNVEIEGEVIQVSNKVMGNTWVKIINENVAIIFRSPNEDEKVEIGNKVKVVGTINTNVDYGYGFAYKVIGVNGKFEVLN